MLGFAPGRPFAAHCTAHCSVCVALGIRAIPTCRHPLRPPTWWRLLGHHQAAVSLESPAPGRGQRPARQQATRVAPVMGSEPPHLTARADDSHVAPVPPPAATGRSDPRQAVPPSSVATGRRGFPLLPAACQAQVRFYAQHRIEPHAPLLVRAPVNSLGFQPCGRTPQAADLTRELRRPEP